MEQKLDFQELFQPSNTNLTLLDGNPDKKNASYPSPNQSNTFPNIGINLNPSKTEQTFQNFWRQIDSTYFKTIKEDDLNQIESLISCLHQDLINTGPQKRPNHLDPIPHPKLTQNKDTASVEALLDAHLQSNPQEDFDDDTSQINQEIENVTKNHRIMHIQNVQKLSGLKDRLMNFREAYEYPDKTSLLASEDGLDEVYEDKTSRKALSSTKINQTQIEYLRKTIFNLEERTIAEGIKYVIDYRKDTDKQSYQFCVIFDDAVCDTEVWIDEDILDRFDSLREHSLFKICHIPQKIQSSLNAFNISAYSQCRQKLIHRTLVIKDRPWKNIIKHTLGDTSTHVFKSYYKESMISKAKELCMCHQCKYLFPDEYLVKCNYRSSKMGLFTADTLDLKASTLSNEGIITRRLPYLYKWKEIEEEFVCLHKFCRNCLKSYYNLSYQDIIYQSNWLCPFCQGICFCSRCTRNDHVNQLTNMYINLKGDLTILANNSPLQKYMWNSTKRTTKKPHNQIIVISRPGNLPKSKHSPQKSRNIKKNGNCSFEPSIQKKLKATTEEDSKRRTVLKGGLLKHKESSNKQGNLIPDSIQKGYIKKGTQEAKMKNRVLWINEALKNDEDKGSENGKQAL